MEGTPRVVVTKELEGSRVYATVYETGFLVLHTQNMEPTSEIVLSPNATRALFNLLRRDEVRQRIQVKK